MTISREIQARALEAEVLNNLADLHCQTQQFDQARSDCEQSLTLSRELKIPLVKECEELRQRIEEESTGDGQSQNSDSSESDA